MQKLLLKKTVVFVAVFLSCVMFVNFTATDFFRANVLSVYATETDEDDVVTSEDLEEDTRYVQFLPLVFKDEFTQLQSNDEGVVSFSTTYESDEFGDLDYNLTFYPPDENTDIGPSIAATVSDENGSNESINSTVIVNDLGGLSTTLYLDGVSYFPERYSSSKSLSNLLQSIYFEDEEDISRLLENPYANIDEITLDSCVDINNYNSNNDENISTASLCGWFTALIIVAVTIVSYVIVTQTAEQIRAESNYTANQSLETPSSTGVISGVALGTRINNQHGSAMTDYKLGFADFPNVGCEVASVYNLMIDLGEPQYLSQVIYDFERWGIEYAVGWGHLGSEPKKIYRYLDKKGINYTKRTNYNRFRNAVTSSGSEYYIESFWNAPWTTGLHTFYIKANTVSSSGSTLTTYTAYNYLLGVEDNKTTSDFNEFRIGFGNFIVGYVILR